MNKIDFVTISEEACKHIIQSRKLQSLDFKDSKFIIDIADGLISSKSEVSDLDVNVFIDNKGVILFGGKEVYSSVKNTITFDFNQLDYSSLTENMKITVIQKTLRFCIKYWGKLGHNSSEIIPLDSTKGVVFPFSNSNGGAV